MTTKPDKCQEAFEKWYGNHYDFSKSYNGNYKSITIHRFYECWQAAWQASREPVAEDYSDVCDVFAYIKEKQERGYFTHPAIVKLCDMVSREQPAGDNREALPAEYQSDICDIVSKYGCADIYNATEEIIQCVSSHYAALTTPAAPVAAEYKRICDKPEEHRSLEEMKFHRDYQAATKPAAQTVPQEVVDALKFYASRKTYRDEAFVDRGDGTHDQSLAILADEGYTARKALALLTDGKDKP
jgi:hypothetical protein